MPPVAAALSISFWSTNDLRPSVWHGVLTPKKAILQLQMSLIGWALGRSLKLLQSIRERFPANWTAQKEKDHEESRGAEPLERVIYIYIYVYIYFVIADLKIQSSSPVNLRKVVIAADAHRVKISNWVVAVWSVNVHMFLIKDITKHFVWIAFFCIVLKAARNKNMQIQAVWRRMRCLSWSQCVFIHHFIHPPRRLHHLCSSVKWQSYVKRCNIYNCICIPVSIYGLHWW